jgi:hypothetical protein
MKGVRIDYVVQLGIKSDKKENGRKRCKRKTIDKLVMLEEGERRAKRSKERKAKRGEESV